MSYEKKLFNCLKEFAVFAGELALPYYGKIERKNKMVGIAEHLHESPVTVLDHGIQEMVLSELIRKNYTNLAFNGEEETHLKFFFKGDYSNGLVVHCDPIDGTNAFASGKNRFAVGFALSRVKNNVHDFFSTIIYSPLEKKLYWSFKDKTNKHPHSRNTGKLIATKNFLNERGKTKLEELGYSFVKPGSGHLGVIDVSLGKLGAITGKNIDIHDALIPFSFARNHGIFPTGENGKAMKRIVLESHAHGYSPLPKIVYFANNEIKDELLPILQNTKYIL